MEKTPSNTTTIIITTDTTTLTTTLQSPSVCETVQSEIDRR